MSGKALLQQDMSVNAEYTLWPKKDLVSLDVRQVKKTSLCLALTLEILCWLSTIVHWREVTCKGPKCAKRLICMFLSGAIDTADGEEPQRIPAVAEAERNGSHEAQATGMRLTSDTTSVDAS